MPEIAIKALSNRQNKARQITLVTAAPYYTGVMAILEAITQIKRRLNQAITARNNPTEVIYHGDSDVQYLSIRHTSNMTDSALLLLWVQLVIHTTRH